MMKDCGAGETTSVDAAYCQYCKYPDHASFKRDRRHPGMHHAQQLGVRSKAQGRDEALAQRRHVGRLAQAREVSLEHLQHEHHPHGLRVGAHVDAGVPQH